MAQYIELVEDLMKVPANKNTKEVRILNEVKLWAMSSTADQMMSGITKILVSTKFEAGNVTKPNRKAATA